MKKFRNIAVGLLVMGFSVVITLCTYYNINMSKVSNDDTIKVITIENGSSIGSIAKNLKENNLIKNITIFKVYTYISNKTNLKAGTYELSEDMGVKKIVNILEDGALTKGNAITLKEGENIRILSNLISENTSNEYDDVISTINNMEYIDTLIDKYWFLTEDIKNSDIYYSLEGYLYPNTYSVNDNTTAEKIIELMLDETDKQLSKYKEDIDKSDLSVHEIITLASVVELEVANKNDRKDVAEVFYNRLKSNSFPTLGSDATSYYGAKIDDWKNTKLTSNELNDCTNKYNTRCSTNIGLPVGPIGNPSIESIEAVLYPNEHDYYYFVNDCDGKLYMTKTQIEHNNIINKLENQGKWCA